jgi:hypothetical protein
LQPQCQINLRPQLIRLRALHSRDWMNAETTSDSLLAFLEAQTF